MKNFIETMRERAEEVYNVRKQHFESKLKCAIEETAEKGDRLAMMCVQGIHDSRNFTRYIAELGLKCELAYTNDSWYWYKVQF